MHFGHFSFSLRLARAKPMQATPRYMSQSTNINKSCSIAREKLIATILMQIMTKKEKKWPISLKNIGLTTFVIFLACTKRWYSIDYEDFFKVNVALGLQLYLLKHVVEYRKVHCKMLCSPSGLQILCNLGY